MCNEISNIAYADDMDPIRQRLPKPFRWRRMGIRCHGAKFLADIEARAADLLIVTYAEDTGKKYTFVYAVIALWAEKTFAKQPPGHQWSYLQNIVDNLSEQRAAAASKFPCLNVTGLFLWREYHTWRKY